MDFLKIKILPLNRLSVACADPVAVKKKTRALSTFEPFLNVRTSLSKYGALGLSHKSWRIQEFNG